MQYVLHDTTAYGIYNGISEADVEDFIFETAKELGLNILITIAKIVLII